jgi:hypothetical protein
MFLPSLTFCPPARSHSTIDSLSVRHHTNHSTLHRTGVRGLFDGISGTWMRQLSYSMCRFWAYDESKKLIGAGTSCLLSVLMVPVPSFSLHSSRPCLPAPSFVYPCSLPPKTNATFLPHSRPELANVEIGLSRKHGYVASSHPRNLSNSIDIAF